MAEFITLLIDASVPLLLTVVILWLLFTALRIVPQSEVYVIERFGKYTRTLNAGLSVLVPVLDRVAHKISILERQLPEFSISVITCDNVEVQLRATVFFRVTNASRTVYRIRNIDAAIHTAATSIVRSAAGKLELDELQSSRDAMNQEIATKLTEAAEVWGVEITRTEITDVIIDEQTKDAQRQQLNAERERRAAIAIAEGERRTVELNADAMLYEAERRAEAVRVEADAQAYAIRVQAQAEADQTQMIAKAILNDGKPAIDFEVMKRQVEAISQLASSESAKTIIMPSEITRVIGGIASVTELLSPTEKNSR